MHLVEIIILGLIQGLTEFIPVSSSGHLVIGQYFLQGSSEHLFLEWINIGTLLALILYFRKRILAIMRDIFISRNYRLGRNIVVTAMPAGIVGFLAADFIASTILFNSVITVLVALVSVGAIMILLDKLPKAKEIPTGEELTVPRALFIGILQIFAFIPGVSRSGSTIIAGRFMGLSPAAAAEYSFLASLPIMCGVTLKLLLDNGDRTYFMENLELLLVGNLVAFVSGLFAVSLLMSYLSRHSLAIFGWYRIGLAAIVALVILVQ